MLEGWYCRTMNEEARQQSALESVVAEGEHSEIIDVERVSTENGSEEEGSTNVNIDYKALYIEMKRNVKNLIQENVYFQSNLRASQRRLLKITRDRSFLLDRLLEYERPELTSSDSDDSDSSLDSSKQEPPSRRRKTEASTTQSKAPPKPATTQNRKTKKDSKKQQQRPISSRSLQIHPPIGDQLMFCDDLLAPNPNSLLSGTYDASSSYQTTLSSIPHVEQTPTDLLGTGYSSNLLATSAQCDAAAQEGQLTKEEIERHLQSRQTMLEVVPEGELPTEVFNNNSFNESIEQMVEEATSGLLMD